MTYKNRFLVLALCAFIGNVSASELSPTEEVSHEVASASEMEELKVLLKVIDSEEFIAAIQILADAMIKSSKIVGDSMIESSKVAAAAMTKASKEFGVEAAKKLAD